MYDNSVASFRLSNYFLTSMTTSTCSSYLEVTLLQVKMGLGGNVKIVISGAAPLASHVEDFLRVVTCAPVVQGYGKCTLLSGLHTCESRNAHCCIAKLPA